MIKPQIIAVYTYALKHKWKLKILDETRNFGAGLERRYIVIAGDSGEPRCKRCGCTKPCADNPDLRSEMRRLYGWTAQ